MKREVEVSARDIQVIEKALVLANLIGKHIKQNEAIWLRDVSYGQFSGNYRQELEQAYALLHRLISLLQYLAKDESFIRATGVTIQQVDSQEQNFLESIKHMLPP